MVIAMKMKAKEKFLRGHAAGVESFLGSLQLLSY
jgi:hypothetical protein